MKVISAPYVILSEPRTEMVRGEAKNLTLVASGLRTRRRTSDAEIGRYILRLLYPFRTIVMWGFSAVSILFAIEA